MKIINTSYTPEQLSQFIDYIVRKNNMTDVTRQKRMRMFETQYKRNGDIILSLCDVFKTTEKNLKEFCANPDKYFAELEKQKSPTTILTFKHAVAQNPNIEENFGAFVKTKRIERMWSQAELAKSLKRTIKFISDIETGKVIPASTIRQLMFARLKTSVNDFVNFDPDKDTIDIKPDCFARMLLKHRRSKSISQKKMAETIGFNESFYQKLEQGEVDEISVTEIKAFCELSGYTPREISDFGKAADVTPPIATSQMRQAF